MLIMNEKDLSGPVQEEDSSLPEIDGNAIFTFACGPESPCYNRCCSDVAIPCTPYDTLRARRALGISSEDFLGAFTELIKMPETGLSLPMLKMIESPEAPCPFVTPAGCSIYEDRPGACRSWPIGRSSSLGEDGIKTRYFLIREEYCQGFQSGKKYTPLQWQKHEGMDKYNEYNDKYMCLLSKIAAGGKTLDKDRAAMCFLALYQLERFRELLEKMKVFSRLEIDESQRRKIMEDSVEGDEACLDFALNWLELLIFGSCKNLRKKD